MSIPHLLAVLIVPALICATVAAEEPDRPASQPTTLPTAEDAKLLEQFEALAKEMDGPMSRAHEVVNQTRGMDMGKTLRSAEPVKVGSLEWARAVTQNQIKGLMMLKEAPAPATLHIPRAAAAVKVDGKLDEAAWKGALEVPVVYQVNSARPLEGPQAKCRLMWNEANLYIAFDVPDTDIVCPKVKHNGPIYEHDCIEFFLLPSMEQLEYWEIEISPLGDTLEFRMTKHPDATYGKRDERVDRLPGMQFASEVRGTANDSSDKDEGYVTEIAVPFKSLPGMEKGVAAGDSLYGLMARVQFQPNDGKPSTAYIGHTPQAGWFHNIWCYTRMVLEGK